ncbi:MAG: DNA-3-methyladenine glycosylase 2 family protein [Actinomycetota bacterium]
MTSDRRRYELDFAADLRHAAFGNKSMRLDRRGLWWPVETPDGLGTLHVERPVGGVVDAEAWGPGASWLLDRVPDVLGGRDRPETFRPQHPTLSLVSRRGVKRFGRTERVFEILLPTILGQKVQTKAAYASLRRIVARYGEQAPGPVPSGLRAFPSAARLASIGSYELHPLGVERKRADTILRAAKVAHRLEEVVGMDTVDVERRLRAVRGIGPWTSAWVRWHALGDADAVPIGDFHIPHNVAWVLAGEPRATDERMLELLAPYEGHRGRVVRMIKSSGESAPKYGPRLSIMDFADR